MLLDSNFIVFFCKFVSDNTKVYSGVGCTNLVISLLVTKARVAEVAPSPAPPMMEANDLESMDSEDLVPTINVSSGSSDTSETLPLCWHRLFCGE